MREPTCPFGINWHEMWEASAIPCEACLAIRAAYERGAADGREQFIDLLWTRFDKHPMPEGHRCVDGELSMKCDGHRGYDKAINDVRNAIKSARRAAIRGEGA